jgi:hypothetical protein
MLLKGSSTSKSGSMPRNTELFEGAAEIPGARARDSIVPCPRAERSFRPHDDDRVSFDLQDERRRDERLMCGDPIEYDPMRRL